MDSNRPGDVPSGDRHFVDDQELERAAQDQAQSTLDVRWARFTDGELEQHADIAFRRMLREPTIESGLTVCAAALLLIARGRFFDKPVHP